MSKLFLLKKNKKASTLAISRNDVYYLFYNIFYNIFYNVIDVIYNILSIIRLKFDLCLLLYTVSPINTNILAQSAGGAEYADWIFAERSDSLNECPVVQSDGAVEYIEWISL